jgi:hypothetical protein
MSLGETVFEQFAGDLEYHPRRAFLYLVLAVVSFCFWLSSAPADGFTTRPIIFALGSLTLALKGVLLLRKWSEGLGLAQQERDALSSAARRKALPKLPEQAAQVVQDFGASSMLLWPLLNIGRDIDALWTDPPSVLVFLCGLAMFGLGWIIRRLTQEPA